MRVIISGDEKGLSGWIKRVIRYTPVKVRETNRSFVPITLSALRRHASGRPGPEVDSGNLLRNFRVTTNQEESAITAENNSPQMARLEYGFVGRDSLGRLYAQPPYPVFRPTFEEIAPRYAESMGTAIREVLQS